MALAGEAAATAVANKATAATTTNKAAAATTTANRAAAATSNATVGQGRQPQTGWQQRAKVAAGKAAASGGSSNI